MPLSLLHLANFSDILLSVPQDIIRQQLTQVPDVCNVDDLTLLNLCGGMPIENSHNFRMIIKVNDSCLYDVSVFCEEFYLSRTIDFNDLEIINNHMRVRSQGNGVGTSLFVNQVEEAIANNFNQINVIATGPENEQTGHLKWGRVGFEMSDMDAANLVNWCIQFGFANQEIFDLLRIQDGYQYWSDFGFSWYGTFDLTTGSRCRERLETYLQELFDQGIRPIDF